MENVIKDARVQQGLCEGGAIYGDERTTRAPSIVACAEKRDMLSPRSRFFGLNS